MKYFELIKLINNKKALTTVAVLMFFALFLSNFTPIAFAQYEGDYYYDYYDYPSYYYEDYSYPSYYYPGTYNYSSAFDTGSYNYPSIDYPGTYNYPASSYGTYTYPSLSYPGTYDYSSNSYGTYNYPTLTNPGTYTYSSAFDSGSYSYPSLAYSGGYTFGNYSTPVASAATIPSAATVQAATVSTGPEGTLTWVLLGGLILSVAVYLILFKIRFRGQMSLAGAYHSILLERKIKEIKNRELKSSVNDFQI